MRSWARKLSEEDEKQIIEMELPEMEDTPIHSPKAHLRFEPEARRLPISDSIV
eukprot:CAMPEP_0197008826 /NCGR_PEP_ID=MMETSP1380-20130617/47036_1 /TAXON_ID=5936 /ORGANISM="Euplotes crassus, Strain CT5" /LENGTH=52 /DNA_ID=CAMNT_0042429643 /DNA_START=479 /DNA_END=637 /DNA_ORIENTATION=+